MTPNYKQQGSYYEYQVRDLEYKNGALLVMKSAASRGAADLMSVYRDLLRIIQVKKGIGSYKPDIKRLEDLDLKRRLEVQKALMYKDKRNWVEKIIK